MKLTDAQIQEFNTNGVLIAKNAMVSGDTQPVIDELSEFIDRRAHELYAEEKISDLHQDAPFERRYGLLYDQSTEIGKGLDIMHMRGKAMFEFLSNENLLDTVESLVGSEITCNPIQHVRPKPPAKFDGGQPVGGFHAVPWHQDAAVMMPEAENSNVITCWLPLGECTIEMGCMQVIPGVHRHEYIRHQKEGGTTIVPDLMPDVKPQYLECSRGDLVMMSRFTPHHSTANLSDKCRWSIDLRYQPTGQHTGRTAHPDFVVRSRSNPEDVRTDYEEWCRLWIDAFENPRGVSMHRTD